MIGRRENLTNMTVRALNALAKDMKLKGYSKLRKAALVEFIASVLDADDTQMMAEVKILDTEAPADADAIRAIMATVAPVTFSASTVKASESVPAAPAVEDAQEDEGNEIVAAYRSMRRTIRDMGNTPSRVKIVMRMRTLRAQLKAMGYNMAWV